jgi:hypothetical protein
VGRYTRSYYGMGFPEAWNFLRGEVSGEPDGDMEGAPCPDGTCFL